MIVLFGFALSVIATRLLLEATGYPQIVSGVFHIAHVLWGGLLLFAAALILLIFRGRRVHWLASLITGVGFGLFIDEVGKFITSTNDYFYPLAAPLIYAFFLITVFIYIRLRGDDPADLQENVYQVLEMLERAIDPYVPAREKIQIRYRLSRIATESSHPNAASLASSALRYLEVEKDLPPEGPPGFLDAWRERLSAAGKRWINPPRLKAALIIGFIVVAVRGLFAAVSTMMFSFELSTPAGWDRLTTSLWVEGQILGIQRIQALILVLIFEAVVGLLLLAGAGFMISNRLRRGLMFGYWGLLFSLTVLYLPILYFEQFEVIAIILLEFSLLLGVIYYRTQYLPSEVILPTEDS